MCFFYVCVCVGKSDSVGVFTSVIVLVQIAIAVADLCFLWWGPHKNEETRKVGTLNG